jgi:MFS family permease
MGIALSQPAAAPTGIRHLVILLATMMAILLYLDRVCVGIAREYIREDMGLSPSDVEWFMGLLFWSYGLAQVPAGWLGDRYGARIMLVVYILTWSFFTAMIGAATTLVVLLGMRLACGLCQAGAYPTAGGLIKNWVPLSGRGLASAFVSSGGRIGGVAAPILTAALMVALVPVEEDVSLAGADIVDAGRLSAVLASAESSGPAASGDPPAAAVRHVWDLVPADDQRFVAGIARDDRAAPDGAAADSAALDRLADILNALLAQPRLHDKAALADVKLPVEPLGLAKRKTNGESLTEAEARRLNRFVLQGVFGDALARLPVGGWRPVLILYGAIGIVLAVAFWLLFRNRPAEHPWVNAAEAELIAGSAPAGGPPSPPGPPPWLPILTSVPMWLNSVMQFTTNIGWLFLITSLPLYLGSIHDLGVVEQGWLNSGVLLVGGVGMVLGGRLTDMLVPRVGLKWGRILPMALSRFTAAAAYLACLGFAMLPSGSPLNSAYAFVAAFAVVAFSTDVGNPALWAYCQDVGGRHVGPVLGWGNMWGNIGAGITPPFVYGKILGPDPTVREWNILFGVCAAAFVVSGLCGLGVDATRRLASDDHAA